MRLISGLVLATAGAGALTSAAFAAPATAWRTTTAVAAGPAAAPRRAVRLRTTIRLVPSAAGAMRYAVTVRPVGGPAVGTYLQMAALGPAAWARLPAACAPGELTDHPEARIRPHDPHRANAFPGSLTPVLRCDLGELRRPRTLRVAARVAGTGPARVPLLATARATNAVRPSSASLVAIRRPAAASARSAWTPLPGPVARPVSAGRRAAGPFAPPATSPIGSPHSSSSSPSSSSEAAVSQPASPGSPGPSEASADPFGRPPRSGSPGPSEASADPSGRSPRSGSPGPSDAASGGVPAAGAASGGVPAAGAAAGGRRAARNTPLPAAPHRRRADPRPARRTPAASARPALTAPATVPGPTSAAGPTAVRAPGTPPVASPNCLTGPAGPAGPAGVAGHGAPAGGAGPVPVPPGGSAPALALPQLAPSATLAASHGATELTTLSPETSLRDGRRSLTTVLGAAVVGEAVLLWLVAGWAILRRGRAPAGAVPPARRPIGGGAARAPRFRAAAHTLGTIVAGAGDLTARDAPVLPGPRSVSLRGRLHRMFRHRSHPDG